MYRVGRSAYAHSNYIREHYGHVWRMAREQASANGVSLSEFISHALHVFMTGRDPEHGKIAHLDPFPTRRKPSAKPRTK